MPLTLSFLLQAKKSFTRLVRILFLAFAQYIIHDTLLMAGYSATSHLVGSNNLNPNAAPVIELDHNNHRR